MYTHVPYKHIMYKYVISYVHNIQKKYYLYIQEKFKNLIFTQPTLQRLNLFLCKVKKNESSVGDTQYGRIILTNMEETENDNFFL